MKGSRLVDVYKKGFALKFVSRKCKVAIHIPRDIDFRKCSLFPATFMFMLKAFVHNKNHLLDYVTLNKFTEFKVELIKRLKPSCTLSLNT